MLLGGLRGWKEKREGERSMEEFEEGMRRVKELYVPKRPWKKGPRNGA